jgi:periplasmic protein TonB
MGARDNRVFRYAVLLSIVLHAAVLFTDPAVRESAKRISLPAPIAARLVEPAPAPAPAEAKPEPVAPPKPQPLPKPPPPVPKAEPVRPAPTPAPVAPAPPAAEPAPVAPAPPAAASAPAASAKPAAPAPRPGADVDADNVARYRMLVIDEARKLKRYPRAALDNSWEGRTRVRVSFGADGRTSSIAVVRGSGHGILDREAVETVTRAAALPVPVALQGKSFAFEIEVVFNLKDNAS